MTSYGVNTINRFDLLSDEPAPAAKPAPVAVAEKPAPAPNAPQQRRGGQNGNYGGGNFVAVDGENQERSGGRGRGGRGRGRGGDRPFSAREPRSDGEQRPYRPRRDGESNPNKREFDHHVPRTEVSRGRGSSRGGRRDGHGRFNVGTAHDVESEQPAADALNQLPAGDGEEAVATEAAPEAEAAAAPVEEKEPEEEDKTLTLSQWQAQRAEKLADDLALSVRQAGEDVVEEDFQNAKEFVKRDITEEGVLGVVGVRGPKSGFTKALIDRPKTADVPIDVVFAAPAGRGRGGRGGFRGESRGGFRGSRQAPVNISNDREFPSLGKH